MGSDDDDDDDNDGDDKDGGISLERYFIAR